VKKYQCAISLMTCLLLVPIMATAGEYAGLTPGSSTKKDAERVFGSPVDKIGSEKSVYSPEGHDLQRLSVDFYDDGMVKSINLLFNQPYAVDKVKEWFGLQGPPDQMDEMMGRRVETYKDQGIKIVFEGLSSGSDIIQLSHVDLPERKKIPVVKMAVSESVDRCPAAAEKYANEADPFIQKDQYAQAITPLKKAAMCDPNRTIYSSMLAFSYWKASRLDEAIDWAKKTLNIEKDYIAYCVLGSSYWEKKDCDSAVPYLEKAVSFSQDKGKNNLELLGACYYQKGRLNDALTTLVKSHKRDRQSYLTLYYLAATSDRLGNKPDAKFYYKKFLRTKKGNQDMIFAAKERLSVLSRETSGSTREKTSQATQMIIRGIFGND